MAGEQHLEVVDSFHYLGATCTLMQELVTQNTGKSIWYCSCVRGAMLYASMETNEWTMLNRICGSNLTTASEYMLFTRSSRLTDIQCAWLL